VHAAVERPGLFALMFRPDRLDVDNPRFQADSAEAYQRLVGHVRAAQDAGWNAGQDTRLLAGVVWAAVHGLASLWSQGALQGPNPDASLDEALELGLELVLAEKTAPLSPASHAPTSHAQTSHDPPRHGEPS
jgi:hypothetical protein